VAASLGAGTHFDFFAVELLNFLRVTPLIEFMRYGYFHRTALPMGEWFKFPDGFGEMG
jgi:hypothetical protein